MARHALLLLALSLPALAGEPPGAYHENRAWGFKIRVPKDWREVPPDQPWIAMKYLGKRELEAQKGAQFWTREAPEMWVVGFPKGQGEASNPHPDWRDYVTRNEQFIRFGDGYEFVEEKETTVDGVKVTTYQLKNADARSITRRIVAWVFHFDDFDLAVQFKVLEWHYADYESSFRGCLKSFKRIERTEALGAPGVVMTRSDLLALPPEKRARAYKDAVDVRFRRETAALPSGWKHKEAKKFLVLTNADDKFVRAALQHAETIEDHIEDLFGAPGKDYVPPAILRIFASEEEKQAYRSGEGKEGLVREIVISAGHGWEKDNAWEDLSRNLWSQWLTQRHPELEETLPAWFQEGFKKYIGMIRTKGSRIGFAHDDWDRDEIRLQIKKDKYDDLLTLLSRGITDEGPRAAAMETHERNLQERTVVTWLMRQGNRGKYKNLLRDLVLNLAFAIEEVEEEWVKKNPRTEANAADYELQKHGAVSAKRGEVLKAGWKRTFEGWDEKDWKRLTQAWLSHAK